MCARRAVWRPGPRWGDQTEVLFFLLGRGEKAATRHVLMAARSHRRAPPRVRSRKILPFSGVIYIDASLNLQLTCPRTNPPLESDIYVRAKLHLH